MSGSLRNALSAAVIPRVGETARKRKVAEVVMAVAPVCAPGVAPGAIRCSGDSISAAILPRVALEKGQVWGVASTMARAVAASTRIVPASRRTREPTFRSDAPMARAIARATFTSLQGSGDFFWPALLSLPVAFPVDGVLQRGIASGANRPDSLSRLRRPKPRAQATVDWVSSREVFLAGSC